MSQRGRQIVAREHAHPQQHLPKADARPLLASYRLNRKCSVELVRGKQTCAHQQLAKWWRGVGRCTLLPIQVLEHKRRHQLVGGQASLFHQEVAKRDWPALRDPAMLFSERSGEVVCGDQLMGAQVIAEAPATRRRGAGIPYVGRQLGRDG
jgi:hypothetical protein